MSHLRRGQRVRVGGNGNNTGDYGLGTVAFPYGSDAILHSSYVLDNWILVVRDEPNQHAGSGPNGTWWVAERLCTPIDGSGIVRYGPYRPIAKALPA
jgi:hypothetical protein